MLGTRNFSEKSRQPYALGAEEIFPRRFYEDNEWSSATQKGPVESESTNQAYFFALITAEIFQPASRQRLVGIDGTTIGF